MFEQQFTRHSRISENLKKIHVQQKYTFDTLYDDIGVGFINQSFIFKLFQKRLKIKSALFLTIVFLLFLAAYSMVTSYLSHIMLIGYAILQTNYEIQRQKDSKKQLLIFWLIFSTDILIENYFAKDKFTLIRYTKFIIVHACFMYRLYILSFILQFYNLLTIGKSFTGPQTSKKSYFQ
ncbi:unnamed protein product (macronuclear) [Paramecium tetraurelia]|uniref:Transmembrane protein n=1 Tax=Paramecium tetraurelia TaxID=5888 RepID=A0CB70_PARTE|nr:uncharacterized protein GSPATT00036820001 [Paramecium tetraurelia]CAK68037.1 unnamed protein product [Paramecium tetraurelia]|eukprot:XP_001435434.1 hypothetical protein (macronuclear) [Paramecium tetraurelia strain d4-2]